MEKKKAVQIVIGVILFLGLGCFYVMFHESSGQETVVTENFVDRKEKQEKTDQSEPKEIYIHICGEVKRPGVYTFHKQPRVIEVVKKAGGLTKKAKQDSINMAERVEDGQQLVIAGKKKSSAGKKQEHDETDSRKININTASKEALMTLTGIGEAKAAQILSYRESNGPFSKIEDIMKISGIKDGVFRNIKDYIVV